jgi:phosphoglycolate phosphatase
MTETAPARAVVFDLDGTLVDSLHDIRNALNLALADRSIRPMGVDETRAMIGAGAHTLVERALSAAGAPGDAALLEDCFARFIDRYTAAPAVHSEPFPGVRAALEALRDEGCALGVCTNKPHDITLRILEALNLAPFFGDAVLGGDAVAMCKPDGGHLLAVLQRTGVAPGAAVMVGDSAADVGTARNAGARVILVTFGYTDRPAEELGADGLISHFDELHEALERL